jgi:endonuclease YncB( thermonuclease family)
MDILKRYCRFMAAGAIFLIAGSAGFSQDTTFTGKVVEVIDGDSMVVVDDKQQRHLVRLAGADAPEQNQDFGKKSKKFLSDMVLDKSVSVTGTRIDRNGEFVARVLVYGRDVSLEMVIAGYAWHYKQYPNEQTERDRQLFEGAELHARKSRFNLWSDSKPVPPWEFRNEPSEPTIELRQLSKPSTPLQTLPAPGQASQTQASQPQSATTQNASNQTTPSIPPPDIIPNGEVLGNKNSKIFHWPGCPGYTKVAEKNRIMFKTRAEAEAAGYRAAKNCK